MVVCGSSQLICLLLAILARVTSYLAIQRAKLKAGEWTIVSSAGGGLGHLAVLYAKLMVRVRIWSGIFEVVA